MDCPAGYTRLTQQPGYLFPIPVSARSVPLGTAYAVQFHIVSRRVVDFLKCGANH